MQYQIVLVSVISVLVAGISAHTVVSCKGDGGHKGKGPYDDDHFIADDFHPGNPNGDQVIEDDFQPSDDYVFENEKVIKPGRQGDKNTYNYNYNYYNKRPNQRKYDYDYSYQTDAPVTTQAPTTQAPTQAPTQSSRRGRNGRNGDFGIGVRLPNLLDPLNILGGAGSLNARVGINGLGEGGLFGGKGLLSGANRRLGAKAEANI